MPENSSWVVGSCPVCSLLYTCAMAAHIQEERQTSKTLN